MKTYAPFLMYQIARFGALTVPQMQKICEGKCKRSALYRSLGELVAGRYAYPILNPASRLRAYYATKGGREYVYGKSFKITQGIRTQDLDHTISCAEVVLELCRYENVTGFATQFEMSPREITAFCHGRIPDAVFQLTQGGQNYELALEVECTNRNKSRVRDVLENYWQTFKYGMKCSGLLIVTKDNEAFRMYTRAILEMPEELQRRAKVVHGLDLFGLRPEAYGQKTASITRCLELTRTEFCGEISYSLGKVEVFSSQTTCRSPENEEGRRE